MARFLVDCIERCMTLDDLREKLDTTPSDLKELYGITFDRIRRHHTEDFQFASMLFSWMVFAKERLTSDEIQHGIAAACLKSSRNDIRGYLPQKDYLVTICGGLITLTQEERRFPQTGKATYFAFVRASHALTIYH